MMQTQSRRNTQQMDVQSKSAQQQKQPLLAFRVLGALPLVNSSYSLAKGYYLKTKESSDFLKNGLDFAETSVLFASSPLVHRYEKIDHYASSKLNQLEELYENREQVVDDVAKKSLNAIKRATYPVGFTLGLASQARDKAFGLATPIVEKAFDYADEVVDNLMPADEPEDAEYLKMTVLQRKNPMRRLKNRTTLISLLNLPSNSLNYTTRLTLQAYHTSSLVADRLFYNIDRLLKLRSNIQLLTKVTTAPLSLVFASNRQKLYEFMKGDGLNYINWSIDETLSIGEKLREYLKENGLPNNADLLDTALNGVKQLQGFIQKMTQKQTAIEARESEQDQHLKQREASSSSSSQKRLTLTGRRHFVNHEESTGSFMTGDDATTEELIHEKQAKSDAKEPIFDVPEILFEQKVDEEGYSRARQGNVGHNQKVIPIRVAHAIAPTTTSSSSSSHSSSALVSNNPYGALLKGKAKHPQEKQTAAHVGKDSLVVMDGMGGVAVAVAKEEADQSYMMNNNKDEGELFFTDADSINGWETVDNERRRRRNHHNKPAHKEAEQQKEEEGEKKEELKKKEEEEEEEKPVNIDEHKLIVKSDVGLVAIAPSHPNWSSSQGDDEWIEPKKTFHHTTLQHEEKKIHPTTTVDAQGNNNPYAVLQSQ